MGLPVQGKQDVEIGLQKRRRPVVHAHQIPPAGRLADLAVIGGQGPMEQAQVPGKDVLPEGLRIGHIEPGLRRRQTAASIVKDLAGTQVVPHTGGVSVPGLMPLHHRRHIRREGVQVPVEDVDVHPVVQGAVVLQLPEMVARLHVPAVPAQNLPAHRLVNGSGAVEIHIPVGFFVKCRPRPGPAQGDGLHLRQCGQFRKQLFHHKNPPPFVPIIPQIPGRGNVELGIRNEE